MSTTSTSTPDYNDVFGFYVNGSNCAVVDTDEGTAPVDDQHDQQRRELVPATTMMRRPATPTRRRCDGFTEPSAALPTSHPVETNHVKLAIADTAARHP